MNPQSSDISSFDEQLVDLEEALAHSAIDDIHPNEGISITDDYESSLINLSTEVSAGTEKHYHG